MKNELKGYDEKVIKLIDEEIEKLTEESKKMEPIRELLFDKLEEDQLLEKPEDDLTDEEFILKVDYEETLLAINSNSKTISYLNNLKNKIMGI